MCDENHTGQRREQSYRIGLSQTEIKLLGPICLGCGLLEKKPDRIMT